MSDKEPDILTLLSDLAVRIKDGEFVPEDAEICARAKKEIWRLRPKKHPGQVAGVWKGGLFHPLPRYERIVRNFEEGVEYVLEQVEERDMLHHAAYFAELKTLYDGLPDEWKTFFIGGENHMRKYALIKCGYSDVIDATFTTKSEAYAFVLFGEGLDKYLVAETKQIGHRWVVRTWIPKSQKRWDGVHGMKNEEFRRSVKEVTTFCTDILGATPKEVYHEAQKHYRRGRP